MLVFRAIRDRSTHSCRVRLTVSLSAERTMFDMLTASGPRPLRTRWLTTSILSHGTIITRAIVGTRAVLKAPRIVSPESMLLV